MRRNETDYVKCPECSVKLRKENLDKHLMNIHSIYSSNQRSVYSNKQPNNTYTQLPSYSSKSNYNTYPQNESGIASGLIWTIRIIVLLFTLVIWAILGFTMWIPLIIRITAWYSVLVVLSVFSPINLQSAHHALDKATTFYIDGFIRIIQSTLQISSESATGFLHKDVEISLNILLKEFVVTLIFWTTTIFLFKFVL
ncbi:Uncharacterised protein [Candidatus Venteria ishoeyi]|uniref:Uncharacterized protein n=1 Tax=Candidatus Venteria ishoeyi TaxID=1899563 RepID=A0A1H6F6Y1_9GAMM|nr:Uncharacterised protein [Candidatus Venteria ishoeyi]